MLFKGNISAYFLIFILIIISVLLYVFKDDFLIQMEENYLSEEGQIIFTDKEPEEINLDILTDNRLNQMERNIPYFDFNEIGRRAPVGLDIEHIPIFDPVHLGNNRPLR